MKVAIPSDNQETITKRTGQSKGFMVYDLVDNKITGSEYRENKMDEHDEEAEHSHAQIIALLNDVDILLVAAIGKHMKKDVENSPIKYQLVQEEKLTQIIDNFLKTN
jgi:predicted Fe-Mo cluster-binding NifX family protein